MFRLALLVGCLVGAVSADPNARAVLEDGDRISGEFVSATSESAVLMTPYAGPVTIQLANVFRLTADIEVWLTLEGREPVRGSHLVFSDSQAALTLPDGSTLSGPLASVVSVSTTPPAPPEAEAPQAEGQAPATEGEPGVNWSGSVSFFLGALRGNTNQNNWRLAANADKPDGANTYGLQGSFEQSSSADGTMRRRALARADYRHVTASRFYYTGFTSLEHDSGQQLSYRLGLGATGGYRLTDSSSTLFGFEAGIVRSGERYFNQPYHGRWDFTAAFQIDRPVDGATSVSGRASLFANPSDMGDFRMVTDVTLLRQLREPFALTVSLLDEYVNRPQPGVQPNDLRLEMGLGYTFR